MHNFRPSIPNITSATRFSNNKSVNISPSIIREDPAKLKKLHPDLLYLVKPIIASLPLPEYSASAFKEAVQSITTLETSSGKWTKGDYQTILKLVALTRGTLVDSQTRHPSISAAVPIVLSAYKDMYGVPYSAWNFDDDKVLPYLLGHSLKSYFEAQKLFTDLPPPEEVRRETTPNGTSYGRITYHQAFKTLPEGRAISKFYQLMYTQLWLFAPEIRTNDMVLSLEGLDVIPPSLDASNMSEVFQSSSSNDLDW